VHNFLQCLILSGITSRFPIAIIFVTDNISDKMSCVIFKYVLSLHKISYIWLKLLTTDQHNIKIQIIQITEIAFDQNVI